MTECCHGCEAILEEFDSFLIDDTATCLKAELFVDMENNRVCQACYNEEYAITCASCHAGLYENEDNYLKFENGKFEFYYKDVDGDLVCAACYRAEYEETCPICHERKAVYSNKPESSFFALLKTMDEQPPGLYKVKRFPFYYGEFAVGFRGFFNEAIELIMPLETIQNKFCLDKNEDVPEALYYICPECMEVLNDTHNNDC